MEKLSAKKKNPEMCFDLSQTNEAVSKIIDRVATDTKFRESVKRDPMKTLSDMGITVSPDIAKEFEAVLKEDPDLLINAMLGKGVEGGYGMAAVPAVIVGVQVAKYVVVGVVAGTSAGFTTKMGPEEYYKNLQKTVIKNREHSK